jgi:3-methyladenine DNA glycosylase/8-oxoguanine DNA glycosylase
MPRRRFTFDGPLDLARTLAPLRRGTGDPTLRIDGRHAWRATRTVDGPASLAIEVRDREVVAEGWGPGAECALDGVPALLGLDAPRVPLPARHPLLARLEHTFPGVRIGRSGAVMEALVPAILEQKVTGEEARTAFRGLVRQLGEPAPGPAELRLRLPPHPARLADLPYYAFHPHGVERRRAEVIRRVAGRAGWFEAIVDLPLETAYARLTALPGVGPWTAAEVAVRALGDADAVSVGDYHIPTLVCWALAGEPTGDDDRMLELLRPFRPYRAVVVRLLEASGLRPQRRGPRMAPRQIQAM